MSAAPLPANEAERLMALLSYQILDTSYEQAFDEIAQMAARLTGSPIALVSLVDGHRQWFKARVGIDVSETPREQSFCAHAILGDTLFEVPDTLADKRFVDYPLVTGNPKIRSYAGMPLISAEGYALGTICVVDHTPRQMSAADRMTLTALAQTAMTMLELHRALARMRELSMTDAITGLPNRPALMEALDRYIARQRLHGTAFSLLYFGIDGFRSINETLGEHAHREVGGALRAVVLPEDMTSRIGGDEFVILMDAADRSHLHDTAERTRDAMVTAMAEQNWDVTVSIGAVRFQEPPANGGEALAIGDRALYAAKSGGRNRIRISDYGAALATV